MGDTFRNSLCAHARQADRASLKRPGANLLLPLPQLVSFRRTQGREMRRNESFKVLGDLLAVGSSKPCIRVDDTLELKETSSVVGSSKPGPFKAAGGLASKVAFEPKV
jgi:hypothetical protein